jgi:hypothetical protein
MLALYETDTGGRLAGVADCAWSRLTAPTSEALKPAWCTDPPVAKGSSAGEIPASGAPNIHPFKLNHDHRHHTPRQQHKVTDWPAREAGQRQRGSIMVWFTGEAIAA